MRDQSRRRAFFDASLVTPDQMPLVQILRWRALLSVGRVCGPDLMFALCEHLLGYGSTHFFYGAAAGVPDRLVAHQRGLFEELKNCGRLVTFIARNDRMQQSEGYSPRQCQWCGCRLGWVGLGGPKQERWSADHRKEFLTRLLVGAGYAFDALSGIKPQAPPPFGCGNQDLNGRWDLRRNPREGGPGFS